MGYALLCFAPVFIAGTIKTKVFAPTLHTVTYHRPADFTSETSNSLVNKLYDNIHLNELGLQKKVLEFAMKGFSKLMNRGRLNKDSIITIVDFSRSSREKRLYVIDLKNEALLFNTRVAHGRNSGMEYARSFSNTMSSNKSSLGFYVTQNTYIGDNGYSLRLEGLERNINDKALRRNIVIHGADYAEDSFVQERGMLGRSFGCPAVPVEESAALIDAIKNGSCLFIYSPDKKYFKLSTVING